MSQELEGTLTNTANLVGTFGSEGGGGTTNYNDLINKPSINSVTLQGNKTASQLGFSTVATSGSYDDLTNKPTIPAAQVNSDWNAVSGVAEILNKPTLAAVATSGDYDDLTNKPTIPAAQVNSDWNAVSGVAEILNKPTIPAAQVNSDWNSTSGVSEILNKPTIPAAQVNSDWNSTSGVSEILNKPTVYQNAASMPISGNDPTDTKTYIDNKVATTSGTATAQTGVSIGSKNLVYKQGIFCYICLVLSITSNISAGDNLVKLPFAINTNQYIVARKEDGTTIMLTGNGEYIKTEFAISSGTILRIGETTLAV